MSPRVKDDVIPNCCSTTSVVGSCRICALLAMYITSIVYSAMVMACSDRRTHPRVHSHKY
jgi:hypothetical protein